jgi:hypothetical protein
VEIPLALASSQNLLSSSACDTAATKFGAMHKKYSDFDAPKCPSSQNNQ